MKGKAVSGLVLMLLLTSMLTSIFIIQPVRAEGGTIYIRADGSVDPRTAPILNVGNVYYTFTADIYDSVVVWRNNIVIDGAGYALQSFGGGTGVNLAYGSNITVKNMEIKACGPGIKLLFSSNCKVFGNNIINNKGSGIELGHSSYNIITGNNITNNAYGVFLWRSNYNSVSDNNIWANSWSGISLWEESSHNGIIRNDITGNLVLGIDLWTSSNNVIYHNNLIGNWRQIWDNAGDHPNVAPSVNVWDDGYPSGGNYWSDYGGVDLHSGPYQNETGSDGIWDHPYVIDANNQDRYPLVNLWMPTHIWPMFQHDPQRTGRSPYVGPKSQEPEVRIFSAEGYSGFGPIAISADGTIYLKATSARGTGLYAFNSDGTEKWFLRVPIGGYPTIGPDGTIYAMSDKGVIAVNPDGTLKWEKGIAIHYTRQYFVIGDGEILYFITGVVLPNGLAAAPCLVALDSNGKVFWVYDIRGNQTWYVEPDYDMAPGGGLGSTDTDEVTSPSIGPDGTVYFGSLNVLYAINPDGTIKWQRTLEVVSVGHNIRFAPAISLEGILYVTVNGISLEPIRYIWNSGLYAISPDGNIIWEHTVWEGFDSPPVIGPDGALYAFTMRYPVDRPIYDLRSVSAIGEIKWTLQDIGGYGIPIVDAEGNIFSVMTGSSKVVGFSPNGQLLWQTYVSRLTPGEVFYGVALALNRDGTLFVSGNKMYAIRDLPPPENRPPVASFTYIPYNPIVGEETTTFNASASYDPDGQIVSYAWDFGDGNITTTTNHIITHAYMTSGTYTVTLTVIDDEGATDSTSKIVIVTALMPNQPPVAFFTHFPESPGAGEETKLDASDSYDPDGEIKFYEWDLDGDGEYDGFTTSPVIFYYWDEGGIYSVKLRVIDDGGATDTFIKDINVQQRSLWEKAKKLFASSVKTLTESEKRRFEIIKSELRIINYPHSDDPSSDPDFYWISDNQLLFVLKKKIDPEAIDLTYETLIIDILHDMKLADSVANRPWTTSPEIEKYFQNMAEINAWAEVPVILLETLLEGIIELGGGSGIGVGSVLMLWDIFQAGVELKLLDETFYRRALWHYFQLREMGYSPETAFDSSPIPIKYDNVATREYFESLWTEYGGIQISDIGGLKQEFKQQIIEQLRTVLLSGLERYKFEPYHVYRIKSPGELRVYDSQGRVTGLINGETTEGIPDSAYDDESKTALVFPATDSYYCRVIGKEEGTYKLTITSVQDRKATTFSVTDISMSVNVVHQYTVDWDALSRGEEGVTVMVDSDADGVFEHTFTSDSELTQNEYVIATDNTPPQTWLNIGEPKFVVNDVTYLTSATPIELIAEDNAGGSGVASTAYRIYNASYDSGWITYTEPFYLVGLSDGTYRIEYNSTDFAGNIEPTKTLTVILDNTGPSVTILNPPIGWALQDGVTFIASAIDSGSGAQSLNISIREANGAEGIFIGFENLSATYNAATDEWTLFFDTLLLPDGYYVVLARAKDNLGNIGPTLIVPYSIRNWAVIELLPASETNKAGRTMPVKFSLRVAASVDPNQPFVYNEELTIKIYAADKPSNILQTSTFGDAARDYRINTISQHYITNFQTLKTAKTYVVDIYRKGMLIDTFQFNTVK